jgi:hypothetical protein
MKIIHAWMIVIQYRYFLKIMKLLIFFQKINSIEYYKINLVVRKFSINIQL